MPRRVNQLSLGLVSNPYPKPKEHEPNDTLCELCDRVIRTRDWISHKNSKKHRELEEAARAKENGQPNNGFGGDGWNSGGFDTSSGFNDTGTGGSGFDSGFNSGAGNGAYSGSGNTGGKQFNGACFSCGLEGHSKRDCPQNSSRGCYNCGESG